MGLLVLLRLLDTLWARISDEPLDEESREAAYEIAAKATLAGAALWLSMRRDFGSSMVLRPWDATFSTVPSLDPDEVWVDPAADEVNPPKNIPVKARVSVVSVDSDS